MSFRILEIDGRFPSPPDVTVELDGKEYSARRGEPLAVTLLAHGVYVLGRSPKYHRPRGLTCGRGACGACLARVDGEPSQRLCLCRAGEHASIESQNNLGGAGHDLLRAVDWVFPGGLDHHHLMTGSTTLNRLAIEFAHRLAGLGRLPAPNGAAPVEPEALTTDVAVVGGGEAGRAAAAALRASGRSVLVFDALAVHDEDGVLGGAYVLGQYDDRVLLVLRHGHHVRVRASATIIATGAHEQLPACPGNDVPGLFLRRAAELAVRHGVLPGRRVVLVVAPDADRTTRAAASSLGATLLAAGVDLAAVAGPCDVPGGPPPSPGGMLTAIDGGRTVRSVRLGPDDRTVGCDAVIYCGRPVPAYELAREMGLEVLYDTRLQGFVPVTEGEGATARPGVYVAGEAAGIDATEAADHGRRVGLAAAAHLTRHAEELSR